MVIARRVGRREEEDRFSISGYVNGLDRSRRPGPLSRGRCRCRCRLVGFDVNGVVFALALPARHNARFPQVLRGRSWFDATIHSVELIEPFELGLCYASEGVPGGCWPGWLA